MLYEVITMQVFDALGRLKAVLVDEVQDAGRHRVLWETPSSLANGTYLARLETERSVETKTIVLLR